MQHSKQIIGDRDARIAEIEAKLQSLVSLNQGLSEKNSSLKMKVQVLTNSVAELERSAHERAQTGTKRKANTAAADGVADEVIRREPLGVHVAAHERTVSAGDMTSAPVSSSSILKRKKVCFTEGVSEAETEMRPVTSSVAVEQRMHTVFSINAENIAPSVEMSSDGKALLTLLTPITVILLVVYLIFCRQCGASK